jgi:hypothetical protein
MNDKINTIKKREDDLAAVDGKYKLVESPNLGLDKISDFIEIDGSEDGFNFDRLIQDSGSIFQHRRPERFTLSRNRLVYDSNIESEVAENNQVFGTYIKGWKRNKAVIILANWNSKGSNFDKVARLFAMAGISGLRLSLPYHDQRKPTDWQYAKYMVSANIGQTISAVRQAVIDVRCAIDWLESKGHTSIAIVGISIGSCIGTIVAAHDTRVRALAQILMASNFAEVVWTGIATKHIRQSFNGFITLPELKWYWASISPDTYVPGLARNDTKTFMLTGKYDPVFPPHLAKEMAELYQYHNVDYRWKELECGHYTLGDIRHAIDAFSRTLFWLASNLS